LTSQVRAQAKNYEAAVNKRKPSPIIFQKALQDLDSPPSKTVYVGDTPTTDIQGAHNTGIKAILIKRPPLFEDVTQQPQKQHPKPQPDYTIQSLTELPSLLKKTRTSTNKPQQP